MRKWKKLGCMVMASLMLAGSVLAPNTAVLADTVNEPTKTTTMAEPEEIALNTNVAGALEDGGMHYYSITTDSKDVDYEFVLVNDTPSSHPKLSLMKIELIVAPFRADGKYDRDQYVITSTWVDPSVARTYNRTLSLKKNTKYLIQLTAFFYETTPYHFAVYQKSKTPTLKKVTAKKSSAKVTFTKAATATSYEVAVKKQGGSWKTYKTKKNTYTIKKLKSKKKYSVRVRSVCSVNGTKKYSAWSKVKKIKVK